MQMYRRKEGKMKVTIGAHTGLILTLPFKSISEKTEEKNLETKYSKGQ